MSDVSKEEESLAPCSIGKDTAASKCHVIFYAKKTGFKPFSDFTESDQKLLVLRSEAKLEEDSIICFHHEALFLSEYQSMQKKCCNPFKKKNHNVKAGLRMLDDETAAKLCLLKKTEVIDIKPGQKLCPRCMSTLNQKLEDSSSPPSTQSEQEFTMDEIEPAINKSLSFIGASPLKRRQLSNRDKPSYAKRKILEAQSLIGNKIAAAVGINYDEQPSTSKSRPCNNCADLDNLIEELKEKCKVSNRRTKVQILTLVPKSWTIKDTTTAFDVSERIVKQARKLKNEQGILAFPANRQGRKLSAEVVQKVHDFFEDDEFSRLCPGKKDCVPVRISGTKMYKQKRSLLCNLKEMYVSYQKQNGPEIGFSKFCELRPKWCVTVGSAGMHSVCVCTIHQNIKLMLTGASINEDYKEILSKAVCSLENKNCMLHRCENCPGPEGVEAAIASYFEDSDPEELIEYKQWIHTDRDTLETKQISTEEYVEDIAAKIWNLSCHHYIAKHQSQHLKALKSDLKEGEFIILMDFAENYSFIVQDAVQGSGKTVKQQFIHL